MFVVEYGRLGLIGGEVLTCHYGSKVVAQVSIAWMCEHGGYMAVYDW